jgi:hypothetical protein
MNERLRKEVMIIEELFMIADKAGKDVPMKLNSAQQKLVKSMTGRDLVPKARQEGVSSLVLAKGSSISLSILKVLRLCWNSHLRGSLRFLKRTLCFI